MLCQRQQILSFLEDYPGGLGLLGLTLTHANNTRTQLTKSMSCNLR
jgi:hypothetical protein